MRTILTKKSPHVNSTKESNSEENSKTKNPHLQIAAILLAFHILTTPANVSFLFIMFIDFSKTPKLFAGYYSFYNVAQKISYVISTQMFRKDLRN